MSNVNRIKPWGRVAGFDFLVSKVIRNLELATRNI
jgi:hypothetical protein